VLFCSLSCIGKTQSPIKGTFISLASDLHIGWNECDWAREFESMSKLGFDTLIIQCVAKIDPNSGQVICFYNTSKFKIVRCQTDWIIAEAEKRGWKVYIGGIEDNVGDDADNPKFLELSKMVSDEIYSKYHSFKSFAGFYISTEPMLNDAGEAGSAAIYSVYGKYLKTKYPDKKVVISPFFATDASRRCRKQNLIKSWHDRSPDEMAAQTRSFLKKCPVDIVAVQDSTCWDVTMVDLRKYLPVIAAAVRAEGRDFWVDTEVFSTSDYENYSPASIKRIAEQIEIEKNYKCVMYCFNWNMDPNGSEETKSLYRQYRNMYFPKQEYCQDKISIIPAPMKIEQKTGFFQVSPGTVIFSDQETKNIADDFAKALSLSAKICPDVPVSTKSQINCIQFKLNTGLNALGPEGYRLEVKENNILIESSAIEGVFYGMQTLKQLFPVEIYAGQTATNLNLQVPCCIIEDMPRFKWRGLNLDVSRHFMPKEFIKKYIDLLAMHKMNVFHWHLTDDQGWRIEIKKYPKLTSVGAWRKETIVGYWNTVPHIYDGKSHGGYYTQDDIREIVAYAKERFITIVPEIDMPGHFQAALAAYPQFGNTDQPISVWTTWGVSENILNIDEETIQFCQDILTEVFDLFPGQYIHIGGDEVNQVQWEKSPKVQSRMRELGLKNESEIQPWFTRAMYSFVTKHNRTLVGWEQILNDDLSGAIVETCLSEEPTIKAIKSGCDVVIATSTKVYLDKYQGNPKREPIATGMTPLKTVYSYEPVPKSLTPPERKHILGVEGQVWTEYMPDPQHVEYMTFPRACAIAEIDWTSSDRKNYSDFCKRLKCHLERLKKLNVNFRPIKGK